MAAAPQAGPSLDSGIEQELNVPDTDIVSWKMLKKLMRLVDKALPIGAVTQLAKGRQVQGFKGSAVDHAWKPYPGAEADEITMTPGTVDGEIPSIGASSMDVTPRPPIAVDEVTLTRIYLKLPMRPLATNTGSEDVPLWVIQDGVIDETEETFEVVGFTAPPTGTPASIDQETGEETLGVYYRHVATVQAGVLTPIEKTPMDTVCCDDGTGVMTVRFWRGPNPDA